METSGDFDVKYTEHWQTSVPLYYAWRLIEGVIGMNYLALALTLDHQLLDVNYMKNHLHEVQKADWLKESNDIGEVYEV